MVERLKIGCLYHVTYFMGGGSEDPPWPDDLLVVLDDDDGVQYLVRLLASQYGPRIMTESFRVTPYRIEKAIEISEKELPLYIYWLRHYDFDWYFKKEV
jgi:hypothetical protein